MTTYMSSYSKSLQASRCLDLVLGEWLSAATVTTLFGPKLGLVNFCCTRGQASDNNGSPPRLDSSLNLKVEAFGSGDSIVPRFEFDACTTVQDLFRRVERELSPDGKEMIIRLFYGEQELFKEGGGHNNTLVNGYNIEDGKVVSVIAVATKEALDKRECVLMLCCFSLSFFITVVVSSQMRIRSIT